MVKNGKTAVIGGIYQLDESDIDAGIPGLKDIPLIGYLFKQESEQKSKNELLLFLKPKIIKELKGPMVSKAPAPGANYDPFEELTVDEGNNGESELDFEDEEVSDDDSSDLESGATEDEFGEDFSEADEEDFGEDAEDDLSLEL